MSFVDVLSVVTCIIMHVLEIVTCVCLGDEVTRTTTWEVVAIKDMVKTDGGNTLYEVVWKGPWKNTWESKKSLRNDELVEKYVAKVLTMRMLVVHDIARAYTTVYTYVFIMRVDEKQCEAKHQVYRGQTQEGGNGLPVDIISSWLQSTRLQRVSTSRADGVCCTAQRGSHQCGYLLYYKYMTPSTCPSSGYALDSNYGTRMQQACLVW